ncbi:MAG: cysteine synthase A [Bacillota bacterium]
MLKNNIIECIGSTPLLKLKGSNIYAKLEYFNPLHSIKDRAALFMIKGAEERGELTAGGTIIEATSGNTGIGLAYIGRQLGYNVILTMPESMSLERRKLLSALGATLVLTPAKEGMNGAVKRAKAIKLDTPNAFIPDQFSNEDGALAHYKTTAQEIITDLGDITPDYLVLAFGSGGSITGISRAFREVYPNIKVVAVEPAESPLLSKGISAGHGIQGIGANFVPKLINRNDIDRIIAVPTETAIATAKMAIRDFGTLCGISSGANIAASIQIQKENRDANIVTVLADTGERYISGALFD